jgi:flagellar biosynthesis/type III secretory pathway protein FliH
MAGVLPRRKTKEMENQEEKETSLEYFYDKVLDASEYYESEYKDILDALNEAKKMYAEEIAKAFEKGYEEGVKYTDGLISDERFPF